MPIVAVVVMVLAWEQDSWEALWWAVLWLAATTIRTSMGQDMVLHTPMDRAFMATITAEDGAEGEVVGEDEVVVVAADTEEVVGEVMEEGVKQKQEAMASSFEKRFQVRYLEENRRVSKKVNTQMLNEFAFACGSR
jgi:hypothetical protein